MTKSAALTAVLVGVAVAARTSGPLAQTCRTTAWVPLFLLEAAVR
jgi:hypothetical protein